MPAKPSAKPAAKPAAKPLWKTSGSVIHRRGLFARSAIAKGEPIIEYVGERISKAESSRRTEAQELKARKKGGGAVYIFDVNKRFDIDGNVSWNPARLINHSCEPNCEAIQTGNRIWIHALRDIAAGEELSYDYGFDLKIWRDHPCLCGSSKCVGYIVARRHWKRLASILEKQRKPAKGSAATTVPKAAKAVRARKPA